MTSKPRNKHHADNPDDEYTPSDTPQPAWEHVAPASEDDPLHTYSVPAVVEYLPEVEPQPGDPGYVGRWPDDGSVPTPLPEIDPDNPERTDTRGQLEYDHTTRVGKRELGLNMSGDDVRFIQAYIGPEAGMVDGFYGPKTEAGVKWYQQARGEFVSGVMDETTWAHMLDRNARAQDGVKRPSLKHGDHGSAVIELQRALNRRQGSPRLAVDGKFGDRTEAAVLAVQRSELLGATGKVNKTTHDLLEY